MTLYLFLDHHALVFPAPLSKILYIPYSRGCGGLQLKTYSWGIKAHNQQKRSVFCFVLFFCRWSLSELSSSFFFRLETDCLSYHHVRFVVVISKNVSMYRTRLALCECNNIVRAVLKIKQKISRDCFHS